MELQVLNLESQSIERNSLAGFDKRRFQEVIAEGSLDFNEWTSLISEIENSFPDDVEVLSLVYDSFLAEFPLCYGYWMKYADHKARLCTIDKVVEVFERAVQSATYSVDVWFHYCSFSVSMFADPQEVRRLFKRGLSFVGKDYLCHTLWDRYLEFEFSQQRWSSLAQIYVQTLRFPSKKLHHYYESFKKLANAWKEELECQTDSIVEFESEFMLDREVPTHYKDNDISSVIKDLLDPSIGLARSKALQKYIFIGEWIYKEACQLDEKINCFETHIRRPYFHVKPLDGMQLKNWHEYLNFAEKQGDFDWVVKLYERCLIPCANYPEFWMRYVDFMENKGGREIANNALARATQIFLKRVPLIHLFNARYKEQTGDLYAAHAAFLEIDAESDSSFIENVTIKANMEKRQGNLETASNIYKKALETAAEKKKLHALPKICVNFSRFTYMTCNSADAARDILIDGIKHVPGSKLLLEELIKFTMMHGDPRNINVVDAVISKALYSGPDVLQVFSLEDVEDIANLYLQFVDLCGTICDVRKAWNQHIKLFPESVRTAYECPAREMKSLRTFMEGRQESIVGLPPQPSGSEHLQQSPSEKKVSPPEKSDVESDHSASDLLSNQKSPLPENHDGVDGAAIDILQSGEADSGSQERMQQAPPEVTERHSQDACKSEVLSLDLDPQVTSETEAIQVSEEFSKKDGVQQEYVSASKSDLKPLSLKGLPLDPEENDSPGSVRATTLECKAPQETNLSDESLLKSEGPQETSLSDGSMLECGQNSNHFDSSIGTEASGSAPIQIGKVSPSSLASDQNLIPESHSRSQMPASGGRNWYQKHNRDKVQKDSRFGFRGHLHKRQYHQRRFSSQQHPHSEFGAQMSMNPVCPSQPFPLTNPQVQQGSQVQSQFPASSNLTPPQAWSMQNVQQQNLALACQAQLPAQPGFYPQAQMSQYPIQSSEQHGHLPNDTAYNQMWQYYYYQQQQQQQFFLQQQQLQLQHQEQQHLQPQQQYHQQHCFHQQQQPPQPQQQQLLPQQQQQQHLLYLQQQLQPQQVEHHHLQQQVQQQEQLPQQLQQEQEQEHRQFEEQITLSQIETWNNQGFKQDQGVTLPCSTDAFSTDTYAVSPPPHHQQQSPRS